MIRNLIALLAFAALLQACESDATSYLPSYSGQQGELIVVIDPQITQSDLNEPLFQQLNQPFFGLPQSEPMFKVIDIKPKGFTKIFETHRSILHLRIDTNAKTEVKVLRNVGAQMQTVVIITAQNLNEFKALADENLQQVLWHFHNKELDRITSRNKAFGSTLSNDRVAAVTGLNIVTQKDMMVAKETKNFIWLRLDREKPVGGYQHQISQGLMIYWKSYTDTASFSDSSLIAWKNEVNARYVDGPQNSHMTTSFKLYEPAVSYLKFRGETAKELRGLWRMDGYFMGGPFYALSFYNPENQRQYMVEGYVFAPQFDKRAFLREIEAIVKSVTPVKNKVGDN